jgi:hypothetical protein
MGDLRQAKYNEEQKLAEKQAATASEQPSPEKTLTDLLANTGIPVQGAAIIAREIAKLTAALEGK